MTQRYSGGPSGRPSAGQGVKRTLLLGAHWVMQEDRSERVVVLSRTTTPFASLDELSHANAEVVSTIRSEHRRWGVVVDMRRAPRRNDAAFEAAMRGLREAVETHFARTAVLLETAVGLLQVRRLTREDAAGTFATQDEVEAFRFARGERSDSGEDV